MIRRRSLFIRSRWALAGSLLASGSCLPAAEPTFAPPAERVLCGWDQLDQGAAVTRLEGAANALPAGAVAILQLDDETRYGELRGAARGAGAGLVRLKLVIERGELLALTLPAPPPPPSAPKPPTESTIVGYQKITRPRAAPRDRIADLRIEGGMVTVFVENEKPGGEAMPAARLRDHLRSIEPPVGTFTLGASDETLWAELRPVLVAAACYDRAPGEEPHEIVLAPGDEP